MRYVVLCCLALAGCIASPEGSAGDEVPLEGEGLDAAVAADETGSVDSSTPTRPDTSSEPAADTNAVPKEDVETAADTAAPLADTGKADTSKPDVGKADAGASAACTAYCGCMKATCTKYSGYPFPTDAACLTKCASFGAAQLKCWSYYCEDAKKTSSASTREHSCRHAWGTLGLEECP